MKIKEIITENEESTTVGKKSKGPKLDKHHRDAIVGLKTLPDLPSHYYEMYRFGVHMAGSPDEQKMDPRSAVANQMALMSYTDADNEIISKSARDLGVNVKSLSSMPSKEPGDVNKVSTTAKPKKNKYGV
jgi:hypothetical protein